MYQIIVVVTVSLLLSLNRITSAEFSPIESIPEGSVKIVSIDPTCPKQHHEDTYTVPNWTIEPLPAGRPVEILTDPPGLVQVVLASDGQLIFHLTEVAFGNETTAAPLQAGVKISIPHDSLETVSVLGPHRAQIVMPDDGSVGFTKIERLNVDNLQNVDHSAAVLSASLEDSTSNEIVLSTAGDVTETTIALGEGRFVSVRARGDASTHNINVKGNVYGRFIGNGDMFVEGRIGGPNDQTLAHFGNGVVKVTAADDEACALYKNGTKCQAGSVGTVQIQQLPLLSDNSAVSQCDVEIATSGAPVNMLHWILVVGCLVSTWTLVEKNVILWPNYRNRISKTAEV